MLKTLLSLLAIAFATPTRPSDPTPSETQMQTQTDPVMQIDPTIVETCARAAHEVNAAYCAALGDTSQQPWNQAPEWQRESARRGVIGALSGNTPRQSHESWLAHKAAEGWRYGLVKDVDAKTHPCFVPYDELPPEQQAKDALYLSTVRAVHAALTSQAAHRALS